jgi:hypothetical protein
MGLIKALVFLGFVALGLLAASSTARRRDDRRAVNLFIAYILLVSFAAGFAQRDAWPFSTWPLVAGTVARPITQPRIVAIDAQGAEYEIDYRAWEPLELEELIAWKQAHFVQLDRASQDSVAGYLLGVVERARRQWAAGERVHDFDRYFGPLSAPLFLGHPATWETEAGVPKEAFVGLRFYDETWDVEERARDPSKVTRRLVYEYRTS